MALDGSGQTTIAAGTDPSWSPDGTHILFKAMDDGGALWVSVVDVATRVVRRLTRGVHPEWSPTGDRILYMRDGGDGGGEVHVMSASGTNSRCLTCTATRSKRGDYSAAIASRKSTFVARQAGSAVASTPTTMSATPTPP